MTDAAVAMLGKVGGSQDSHEQRRFLAAHAAEPAGTHSRSPGRGVLEDVCRAIHAASPEVLPVARDSQDADAADVTQEVMAKVAQLMHSSRYSPERGRFRDWLGTLTRRKVNRHLTKKNRGTTGVGGDNPREALENLTAIEADADWTAEFNAQILRAASTGSAPCLPPQPGKRLPVPGSRTEAPPRPRRRLEYLSRSFMLASREF